MGYNDIFDLKMQYLHRDLRRGFCTSVLLIFFGAWPQTEKYVEQVENIISLK